LKYLNHNDAINLLTQQIIDERLIPIFGSGFTKDSPALSGKVPDGKRCTELMGTIMKKYNTDIPAKQLEQFDFNEMARRFKKACPRSIPKREYMDFFKNNFTEVQLDNTHQKFLNLPWPYAFTLNVDDGIEKHNSFTPILPYQNFRPENSSKRLLYKLHGDANHEIAYASEDNIVFDSDQYTQSLNSPSNQTMRECISCSYKEFNLLFIGCSLKNEPDIKYIYKSIEKEQLDTIRIVLKTKKPTALEEDDLEDYGINHIILVDDFDLFYLDLINEFSTKDIQNKVNAYPFTNPQLEIVDDNNFKYFSGFRCFDESKNKFYTSRIFIERDYVNAIRISLENHYVVFLEGRRFSGKTSVLRSLCATEKKRTVFFFPSTSLENYDVIYNILSKNQNVLLLFDSNSLSHKTYHMLQDSFPLLVSNNNCIVITLNQSDAYLSEIIDSAYINIDSRFSIKELHALKPLTDSFGFVARKEKNTNLDYLDIIKKEQEIQILPLSLPNKYTINEHILLLLLSVKDKAFSRDINSLGITQAEIDNFLERTLVLIEKIKTVKGEKNTYSTYKLVHNSKSILLGELRKLTPDATLSAIKHIIATFKNGDNDQKRIYREVMQFDTLNQVFGRKKGAGQLIFKVYSSLENELREDLHYWLQRSKSIYRLMPNSYNKLKDAYAYAKKAYLDSSSESLTSKSALTVSLICSLLYALEWKSNDKARRQVEAIELGHKAIFSSYYKQEKRLKSDLNMENSRKNYVELIKKLCSDYLLNSSTQEYELRHHATEILSKLTI